MVWEMKVGEYLFGKVVNILEYGVFVKLYESGKVGLISRGDLTWSKITHPEAVVAKGQEVVVKVLSITDNGEKIALSLREAKEDPWDVFNHVYDEGDTVTAVVANKKDYGIFVTIIDGVDAMIHCSSLDIHPQEYFKGNKVDIEIENIDRKKKRVSAVLHRRNNE